MTDLPIKYEGPIAIGMTFVWEPFKPHARQIVTVSRVVNMDGDESRIFTGDTIWNDESRFREAVIDVSDVRPVTVTEAAKVLLDAKLRIRSAHLKGWREHECYIMRLNHDALIGLAQEA